MAKKTKKNKKAKRAKYTTAGRVDMSKGGRVKMARGSQAEEKMLEDEIQQVSVQPTKKRPTGVSITPPSPEQQPISTGGSDPRPAPTSDPMPDSDKGPYGNWNVGGGTSGLTGPRPIPTSDDAPRGGKVIEGARTPEELKQQEQLSYVSRGIDEDLTSGRGDAASIERGDIQRDITPEQRRAAEAALRAAQGRGPGGGIPGIPGGPITGTPVNDDKEIFEKERAERIIETGRTAEQIAAGEIPEGLIPKQELVSVAKGEEYLDTAVQMGELTAIEAEKIKNVTPEQVAQMEAAQVDRPEVIEAAKMQAAKITESPTVQAAQGEVRDESLAKAAKVDRVAPIEGADVEIPEGALTERVVGVLSEGAKSTAALNIGSSLSRITRAKKQLSNAGLTDSDIAEIGNDPEALEARLADFSEEDRGIIEGLPEEALVSTQISSLLEGIEEGNIPPWAAPAVARVEQMLAARGMSASTVGRDALLNTIMQAALPIAQSNAQAIQASVSQQKNIEAAEAEANAARMQQTALTNANNVFQMDMAQFSADQQTALSNSKFLQTVGLTEANNDQQAAVQNAVLMSQANLAEADFYQKSQIQNAQAFLQTDMQNLNNQQQVNVLKAQQEQQRLLSNQAAENAARQLNTTNENQTRRFMSSLNAQINQFNVQQSNASAQFNAQQANAAEARRVGIEAEINKANAALVNRAKEFNAQLDFNRSQWNAANKQAVQQSNVAWRRKANLADTAAANAINENNVKMAFGLSSSALSFLWQELRDQADYDFRWADNTATRKNNAMIAAASSEGDAAKNWSSNYSNVSSIVDRIFGGDD